MELIKLGFVLRELAQLAHAVRSPVAAVKDEQDAGSALVGKPEGMAVLIVEGEVGCGLALSERALRLGHAHLGSQEKRCRDEQAGSDNERNPESAHKS
jgi:hypothetical protein